MDQSDRLSCKKKIGKLCDYLAILIEIFQFFAKWCKQALEFNFCLRKIVLLRATNPKMATFRTLRINKLIIYIKTIEFEQIFSVRRQAKLHQVFMFFRKLNRAIYFILLSKHVSHIRQRLLKN